MQIEITIGHYFFQSLYEEMILNGVIRKYPKVSLSDFYGGISYTASKLKNNPGRDPNPGGGDIRRAIAEYCILPMCTFMLFFYAHQYYRMHYLIFELYF